MSLFLHLTGEFEMIQIKKYSTHWTIRILNAQGEAVQVWTGKLTNQSWFKECKARAKKIVNSH